MNSEKPDYLENTLVALRKACRAFPQDGNLWIQIGIVAFRSQKFEESREALTRARGLKLTQHVEGVRELFLARCLDIEGKRADALALYQQGLQSADPKLRKAMRKGMRVPYKAKNATSLLIDLQFPDTFHY